MFSVLDSQIETSRLSKTIMASGILCPFFPLQDVTSGSLAFLPRALFWYSTIRSMTILAGPTNLLLIQSQESTPNRMVLGRPRSLAWMQCVLDCGADGVHRVKDGVGHMLIHRVRSQLLQRCIRERVEMYEPS